MIIRDVVDLCAIKGVAIKSNADPSDCTFNHMAISLFPTPLPLKQYEEIKVL